MSLGVRATSRGSLGLSGQPVKPVVSTELNEGPHLRKVKRGSNIEDTRNQLLASTYMCRHVHLQTQNTLHAYVYTPTKTRLIGK